MKTLLVVVLCCVWLGACSDSETKAADAGVVQEAAVKVEASVKKEASVVPVDVGVKTEAIPPKG